MDLKLSIPLDDDGFIELECDFCKNRFMLHEKDYSNDSNLHFFCPICGLPNDINTFFCPEVLEVAEQMAADYIMKELEHAFKPLGKTHRKNGIHFSIKTPKREPIKELYTAVEEYSIQHKECCNLDVKVSELDIEIGTYCPICGRTAL